MAAQRGCVYRIELEPGVTVLGLVVTADWINRHSSEYAVVQVTSASGDQRGLAGAVRLTSGDPAFGWVVCRDIGMVAHEELKEELGPLSADTMTLVSTALKQVLGL